MRFLKSHPIASLANGYLIDSPQPSNLSYMWNFGSLLGFCLMIQIITGVTLAMHYNPSVLEAFNSVEHIMRDVNNGWLIRYLHSNTASAFFFIVYLHIGRGLYYGSYKAPRTLVWTIGTVIFILMMATAFLGYVLPYGQMSLWGATVITNLMSAIPWLGQDIVEFLWGGFSVNNATLNRFFALHFVLPFVIAALVIMHMIALHESAGSSNPLGVSANYDRLPFAPFFVFKDLITIFLFIVVLSVFVFFMPNVLGDSENYVMANPMQTPPAIVPEWYLLPFYAILRSIPNKLLGVIAMFASILSLLIMVLSDMSIRNGLNFTYFGKIINVAFIANFFMLMQLGAKHVEYPYIELGQISTIYYFSHFLIIVPLVSMFENSLIELSHIDKKTISKINSEKQEITSSVKLSKKNSKGKLSFHESLLPGRAVITHHAISDRTFNHDTSDITHEQISSLDPEMLREYNRNITTDVEKTNDLMEEVYSTVKGIWEAVTFMARAVQGRYSSIVKFTEDLGEVEPRIATRRDGIVDELEVILEDIDSKLEGDDLSEDESLDNNFDMEKEDGEQLDLHLARAEAIYNSSKEYVEAHVAVSFTDSAGGTAWVPYYHMQHLLTSVKEAYSQVSLLVSDQKHRLYNYALLVESCEELESKKLISDSAIAELDNSNDSGSNANDSDNDNDNDNDSDSDNDNDNDNGNSNNGNSNNDYSNDNSDNNNNNYESENENNDKRKNTFDDDNDHRDKRQKTQDTEYNSEDNDSSSLYDYSNDLNDSKKESESKTNENYETTKTSHKNEYDYLDNVCDDNGNSLLPSLFDEMENHPVNTALKTLDTVLEATS